MGDLVCVYICLYMYVYTHAHKDQIIRSTLVPLRVHIDFCNGLSLTLRTPSMLDSLASKLKGFTCLM